GLRAGALPRPREGRAGRGPPIGRTVGTTAGTRRVNGVVAMYLVGGIVALGIGIYIGLGFPGLPGPEDRVLPPGARRRRKTHFTPIDLLRRHERASRRRRW